MLSVYSSDPVQAQGDNAEKPPSPCLPARTLGDRYVVLPRGLPTCLGLWSLFPHPKEVGEERRGALQLPRNRSSKRWSPGALGQRDLWDKPDVLRSHGVQPQLCDPQASPLTPVYLTSKTA